VETMELTYLVGITMANGTLNAPRAAISEIPGTLERICAAEIPNTPTLLSVGRRCLNYQLYL
jgi:hypothetical protein